MVAQFISSMVLLVGAIAFLAWLHAGIQKQEVAALLQELHELRSDNRALMEALGRKHNQPLIFTRQEIEKSATWWDSKPDPPMTETLQN